MTSAKTQVSVEHPVADSLVVEQKRYCVTSSVTAIRAPTYKEVAREEKKIRQKENPRRNPGILRHASLRLFTLTILGTILRDDPSSQRNSVFFQPRCILSNL